MQAQAVSFNWIVQSEALCMVAVAAPDKHLPTLGTGGTDLIPQHAITSDF